MAEFSIDASGVEIVDIGHVNIAYVILDVTDFGLSRQLDFDAVNDRWMEAGFWCIGGDIAAGTDGLVGGTYWLGPFWIMFEHQQWAPTGGSFNTYDHLYVRLASGVSIHVDGYSS